jgi:hypothetical protein
MICICIYKLLKNKGKYKIKNDIELYKSIC